MPVIRLAESRSTSGHSGRRYVALVFLHHGLFRTTPSYVSFSDNERLIGDVAKNQVAMNPHNTYIYPSVSYVLT